MRVLDAGFDLDRFFGRLTNADRSVLLLDYDGTLAPFRLERDRAKPYAGVAKRLARLVEAPSVRTVIISGRWSRDLIPLLGLKRQPEIWGCHGAEWVKPNGEIEIRNVEQVAIEGLVAIDEWARKSGLGERIERKPTSVAFHWRGIPPGRAKKIRESILDFWSRRLSDLKLESHEFDGGLELRAEGIHKGRAVRSILDSTDRSEPIAYLGDDLTDEDAFAALPDDSLKVLVRKEFRQTKANLWLTPPKELLAFLDRWLECAVGQKV